MKGNRWSKLVIAALVLALLMAAAPLPLPSGGVERAAAVFPGPNLVVGFFKTLGALGNRNAVYREAGATAQEINAYYDRLIAQSQSTRRELISQAAAGGEYPVFVRSYVRIEAALEAERAAAIQMIEAEKNTARKTFERTLAKQVVDTLIASPGGQRVLGRVRETLTGAREAAVAVQAAADAGRPIQALADALAEKVGGGPIVQEAARGLGSMVGHGIDRALGGALGRVEAAVDDVQGEMGSAIGVLDQLDADVARYDEQERQPVSLVEDATLLGSILPVDRANAAADVAAGAYARAAEIAGALQPGTSRGEMRDRIRSALLDERLAGIWNAVCGTAAGQTYCVAVDRGAYEAAASQLGETPAISSDPNEARYWACYDVETQAPRCAKMIGPAAGEEADAEPTPTEPPPTEAAPPAVEVDPCTLLPVDEGAVTMRSDVHCVASIDAQLGCDTCGSEMSITRVESAERAAQLALETYCGNPNFFACGDSPIGDAGVTSTDTSGEPYRPEVAYTFFRLSFSYGRYLVSIAAEIPGKEELVTGLGQEVIERIEALGAD
jgi:hypothetical protein